MVDLLAGLRVKDDEDVAGLGILQHGGKPMEEYEHEKTGLHM